MKRREVLFTHLVATGLLVVVLMVLGVFCVVLVNGIPNFWPRSLVRVTLKDGTVYLGEKMGREIIPETTRHRIRMKIGNRRITQHEFVWIDEASIVSRDKPADALLIERTEWGNACGFLPKDLSWDALRRNVKEAAEALKAIKVFEKRHVTPLNDRIVKMRRDASIAHDADRDRDLARLSDEYEKNLDRVEAMRRKANARTLKLPLADGSVSEIPYATILHVYRPNTLSLPAKSGIFFSRIVSFIFSSPRESNTEGGVFPALYGTILMVLLMSLLVFPLGVMAAIYLSEYAREGFFVKLIRVTIFNLASVPSIVYGIFGLGFFVYTVGGGVDKLLFSKNLPNPTFGTGGLLWASLTLALLTLPVVIVASLEGLNAVPREFREGAWALGATRWEVIKDVVIPTALPGMLTGLILAISRAAGEVAPLMLTGVVKSAPAALLDAHAPFIHLNRKFMHLGFHIYDVGFQSPNVEAARPMVFNTTLLLLLVVFLLNLGAVILRNRIRKKFKTSGV